MSSRPKNSKRLGYTLLEVILASMLAAVVMLVIATSIEIQLRAFKAGRAHVEEAQLARVLLRRIDDDLRALVSPGKAAAAPARTASSEDSSKSKSSDSDSDFADDKDNADDEKGERDDEATWGGSAAGVYGEIDRLRIDVLRTKRRGGSSSDEIPSNGDEPGGDGEIETIVYYVLTPDELAARAVSTNSGQSGGGLVRRELVRPTAAWAAENGMLEYHDTTVTPIAAEVRAIEFRYHDGMEWLESWDSSESGGLPKAFEIRLFFAQQTSTTAGSDQRDELPDVQYRLVVPVMLQGASGGVESLPLDESAVSTTSDTSKVDADKSDSSGVKP